MYKHMSAESMSRKIELVAVGKPAHRCALQPKRCLESAASAGWGTMNIACGCPFCSCWSPDAVLLFVASELRHCEV